jgi:cell division protein FtsB
MQPSFVGNSPVPFEFDESARLKRNVSELEREVALLRREGVPVPEMGLKESLAGVLSELKLSGLERARERAKLNGELAAQVAKKRALEDKIERLVRKCRDAKIYRFLAKKAQAELASFVARRMMHSREH